MSGIMSMVLGAKTAIAAAVDAYFNLVTLLLPGNGTNGAQNNTFLDSSTNNFTITRNGNTTQGTFSPFSQTGWSNFFNGSSNLGVASQANLALGTGDFTIEYFVYPTSFAANNAHIMWTTSGDYPALFHNTSGNVVLDRYGSTTIATTSNALTLNAWNYVVCSRVGTTLRIFINGTQGASVTNSTNWAQSAIQIGNNAVSSYLNGYLSNLRVVKGSGVSSVTVPTAPLTAITNTQLLTCQDNRFIDNSSNAFAITVNGTPSVQAFSPFAPTAAYDAATNGGSAYSDGSGDYLTIATNANLTLGASDFTIELWWYPTAFNSDGEIFTMGSNAGTNRCYAMYSSASNGTLSAYAGTGGTSWDIVSNLSMGTARQNAWNHMAFTRSGSTFSTYLNGSRIATTTASGTLGSSGLGIFANNSGTSQAPSGYIGGARTIKGTALYTGTTYTVPTAPFTAVTNTNLLLNFTNAGITDATAKNVLETVGNAQISTTQSKFGGSSMYFDGTGDYLPFRITDLNKFGSSDFTMEFWLYRNNSTDAGIYSDRAASGSPDWSGFCVFIWSDKVALLGSSGGTIWQLNTVATLSGNNVPTTTWTHIAITRSGTTFRVFIDGTLSYSTTFSGSLVQSQSIAYIGADIKDSKYLNGYIDDFRITKGYARYTASFTPPTAAFPLS